MGVIVVELWIVLLYVLITDGNSFIHEASPAKNTGFLNKLRIVILNRSAKTALLSV